MSQIPPENEAIQKLLDEVRQTIHDNQRFLKRLRDDDAELESEENGPEGGEDAEEDFEEL